MLKAKSFADLDDDSLSYGNDDDSLPPFWVINNSEEFQGEAKEKQTLDWLNRALERLLEWREPITRVQKLNTKLFKGKHYISQEDFQRYPVNRNRQYSKNHAKIVINHLAELAGQHVADMVAYPPALSVVPANDEERDKVAARMNKELLDWFFYENKVELRHQAFELRRKIHGETFLFVVWDPDCGDLSPQYRELRRMKAEAGEDPDMPMPLMDPDTGEQLIGEDGDPLVIRTMPRVGDVKLIYEFANRVYYPYPASGLWEDVPWIFRVDFMDIDEAKARWPHRADKIKRSGLFESYFPAGRSLHPKVLVRYFYHPPTRFMELGYYCVSTEEAFLEAGKYPFNHNGLPCVRATDIEIPGEIHGMSFFQNLVSLQHAINNSTSMILQNQTLLAYPKWFVQRGSKVRNVDLGDDRTLVEYSGNTPPKLESGNVTPQEVFEFRKMMRDDIQTISAVYGTSRGQPPSGITANVALRMLDEQEEKRKAPIIRKHNEEIVDVGKLILSTMGTYYRPDDERMIRIVGNNNSNLLRHFDVSNLSRAYEVRLQKSSGLPESKAARAQTVLDYAERFPDLWSHDEVLEMLEIARPEKLVDSATVARQTAEAEMEDLLQGRPVNPPSEYDEILPKYRVYVKTVQSRAFKDDTDPVIQQAVLTHILTAEYLMWKKIQLNPAFSQLVQQQSPYFPIFFPVPTPDPDPVIIDPMQMMGPDGMPLAGMPPQASMGTTPMGPGAGAPPPQGLPPPQPGPLPSQEPVTI